MALHASLTMQMTTNTERVTYREQCVGKRNVDERVIAIFVRINLT